MVTKTVVIDVTSKEAIFPVGTVEEQYLFEITSPTGSVVFSVNSDTPSATFTEVPEGSYIAKASKNGFEASASFEILAEDARFQVPETLTVTLQ